MIRTALLRLREPRLAPRAYLPQVESDQAQAFFAGWWHGMAIGAVIGVAVGVIWGLVK